MADLTTSQTSAYTCSFWCELGTQSLLLLGMIIAGIAFQGLVFGVYIAIQGCFDSDRPSSTGRAMGAAMAIISWIIAPVSAAVTRTMTKGPLDWSRYPEALAWIMKGWVIGSLDAMSVVAGAFLIYMGSSHIKRYLEHQGQADASSRNPLLCMSPEMVALVFEIVSSTILGWTALNVIFYAVKYGIFERHGGVQDFFHCYLYTLFAVFAWGLWSTGFTIGYLGLVGFIGLLGCCIYMAYDNQYGKHDIWNKPDWKELRIPARWSLLSGFVGATCFETSWFVLNCTSDENRLKAAVKQIYESGASNATLSWAVMSNFTGSYNITTEPYRPAPPLEHGIGPISVEFRCYLLGGLRFLPWLGAAALLGALYGLWQYWLERKEFAEGKAYEMASRG